MSNLDQLVLVLSSKMPKPDLLTLDKQLVYASYLKVPAIIVVNKMDLDNQKSYLKIKEIYEKIGYPVIRNGGKGKKRNKGSKKLFKRKN